MTEIRDITGTTRVLGILADPIAHVKAPPGINRIARQRGRDAVMVPFQVAPADLAHFAGSLRALKSFDGAIITVPHKGAMARLCDEVSPSARAIGAVNVIRRETDGRLVGDMLDGRGFVAGLAVAGIPIRGLRAYLAGAGGAANAIAFALVEGGVAKLTIANRTRDKAEALRQRILELHPEASVFIGDSDPSGHDLIVNGTSLGMREDDASPLDTSRLTAEMIVAEVIMVPTLTPLLIAAQAKGCRIHLGKPMLDQQLELMADYFGL